MGDIVLVYIVKMEKWGYGKTRHLAKKRRFVDVLGGEDHLFV